MQNIKNELECPVTSVNSTGRSCHC